MTTCPKCGTTITDEIFEPEVDEIGFLIPTVDVQFSCGCGIWEGQLTYKEFVNDDDSDDD